jgi:hypothetical protein
MGLHEGRYPWNNLVNFHGVMKLELISSGDFPETARNGVVGQPSKDFPEVAPWHLELATPVEA